MKKESKLIPRQTPGFRSYAEKVSKKVIPIKLCELAGIFWNPCRSRAGAAGGSSALPSCPRDFGRISKIIKAGASVTQITGSVFNGVTIPALEEQCESRNLLVTRVFSFYYYFFDLSLPLNSFICFWPTMVFHPEANCWPSMSLSTGCPDSW